MKKLFVLVALVAAILLPQMAVADPIDAPIDGE